MAILGLLAAAGCGTTGGRFHMRECSSGQVMRATSDLRIGMSVADATSVLKSHGIIQGGPGLESGFRMAHFFPLSENFTLVLVFDLGVNTDSNVDLLTAGTLSDVFVQDGRDGTTVVRAAQFCSIPKTITKDRKDVMPNKMPEDTARKLADPQH